jgi:putrescine aminotransferase
MAGLWCTAVGYGRDSIVDAVAAQMRELPFYNTFFQSTHPPVTELSAQLATLTPPQFNRFFYCGSGSEAIDTVIRLVMYYWQLQRQAGAERDRVAPRGLPWLDRGGGLCRRL